MRHWAGLLLLSAAHAGCADRTERPTVNTIGEELARVSSPDSLVDAVLTRTNPHATVSYVYRVFIVARGTSTRRDRVAEVFRADDPSGLSVAWPKVGQLEIRYERARIFHFQNFWSAGDVHDFTYEVEIHLRPG